MEQRKPLFPTPRSLPGRSPWTERASGEAALGRAGQVASSADMASWTSVFPGDLRLVLWWQIYLRLGSLKPFCLPALSL